MKAVAVSCPMCGAKFETDEENEKCFCTHCGTQIMLQEESHKKYTYRKVDDARIKEAEVKQNIELKKLELKENKEKREEREERSLIILATVSFAVLLLIG